MAMLCFSVAMAQKVTIDGITYKVHNGEAYVSSSDKKLTEAIIRSSVEIDGNTYPVTMIKYSFMTSGAFCDKKNLRKVSIPNSIRKIERRSFQGCRNLTELIIPDNPIEIDNADGGVFLWCNAITTVRCQNGTFSTYILSSLPGCPFYEAFKHGVSPQQLASVIPAQQLANSPIDSPIGKEDKAQLSDIDQNIPGSTTENENTFALIIANENYQEEPKVEYALNDGETFLLYCKKTLGIPEENVHLRKDATLNNIKTELDWMRKIADAYKGTARFMVYYHGHSTQDQTALLPIDGKKAMSDTGYSLQELFQVLGNMSAASISVFLDTNIRNTSLLPQGKTIVFTAATETEEAYPFKEKGHNLFTYYLLKKLQATNGDVSLGELETYLKEQVVRKSIVTQGKSQTPSVNVSAAVGETWKNLKLK